MNPNLPNKPTPAPPQAAATAHPLNGASNIRPIPTLHGVWKKDFENSDMEGFKRAMDGMRLGRMQKMAACNMINGLQVKVNESHEHASIQYLTKVPTPFKITEQYHRDKETTMKRRDMRAGKQRAVVHTLEAHHMKIELAWDGELPGRVHETFEVNDKGQLIVRGVMEVNGNKYEVKQVYNKEES